MLKNQRLQSYAFLQGMYDDGYFPNFLVDKGKAILVSLCEQIEKTKPLGDEVLKLTHAATEEFNELAYDECKRLLAQLRPFEPPGSGRYGQVLGLAVLIGAMGATVTFMRSSSAVVVVPLGVALVACAAFAHVKRHDTRVSPIEKHNLPLDRGIRIQEPLHATIVCLHSV